MAHFYLIKFLYNSVRNIKWDFEKNVFSDLFNIQWFDEHLLYCDNLAITQPLFKLASVNTQQVSCYCQMKIFVLAMMV